MTAHTIPAHPPARLISAHDQLVLELVKNRPRDLPDQPSADDIQAFLDQVNQCTEALQAWYSAIGRHADQSLSLSGSMESAAYGHMFDLQSDVIGMLDEAHDDALGQEAA